MKTCLTKIEICKEKPKTFCEVRRKAVRPRLHNNSPEEKLLS